jgi:murein DD-endopeptidase MepM/ murein hydrolase activator NlpD
VQQSDVIGYVGMTGLATGPHLHYEYLTNGVHRNPQTVQLPGAEPLHAEALQRFRDLAAPLIAALSPQLPGPLAPAAAGAAALNATPAANGAAEPPSKASVN